MKELDHRIEHVVNWLRRKVSESRTNGLVVGNSGGVDSAVVSFLIKRAFPHHSLSVVMPCHSDERDAADAQKVAEACGIQSIVVDLSSAHDQLVGTVVSQLQEKDGGRVAFDHLVDGNLRARLRMSTLYAIANHYNYLVAGTDNAAELYTGYFTKYGDGGCDVLPIAHLLKHEVYQWAEHLGVPERILARAPSAGLWHGQHDETEMGVTYSSIDDFLLGKPIPDAARRKISDMHRRTAHKRTTPAMPPKFSDETGEEKADGRSL